MTLTLPHIEVTETIVCTHCGAKNFDTPLVFGTNVEEAFVDCGYCELTITVDRDSLWPF